MASLSAAHRGEALLLESLKFEHLEKVKKVECFITSMFCAWSFRSVSVGHGTDGLSNMQEGPERIPSLVGCYSNEDSLTSMSLP